MVSIAEDVWGIGIGQGGLRTWYIVNEQLLVSICMIDRRRVALYVAVLLDSSLTGSKVWGSAEARLHGMLALSEWPASRMFDVSSMVILQVQ